MPDRTIGAFVFPDAWKDISRFREVLVALREHGVNAILTESETYETPAIDAAHDLGLRFYAGIACFSDHAKKFRSLTERPELWPILESGEPRPLMEWYIGISPTHRRHQEEILATIRSIAADHPIDGIFLDFVRWPVHWEIELRPGRVRPPGFELRCNYARAIRANLRHAAPDGTCGVACGLDFESEVFERGLISSARW